MSSASAIAGNFAALAARAERLQRLGRWASRGGMVALALGVMAWWPDPAGPDLFTDYVAVPSPLYQQLAQADVPVRLQPAGLLTNGAPVFQFGLMIFFFIPGHILIQRLKSRSVKYFAYSATPVWLLLSYALLSNMVMGETSRAGVARTGILVDHAGAPPAKADGTSRPPVPAYQLRPEAFGPAVADQALYVLAQQAYLDGDATRAAAHLRALSGSWRPEDRHSRDRIGMVARWAETHGADSGVAAEEIGGGGPPALLRRLLSALLLAVAALGIFSAMTLDIFSTRRKRTLTRLEGRSAEALATASIARAPTFGRRTAQPSVASS